MYTVDDDGLVYKFMALNTVESESVPRTHEFARCGDVNNSQNECAAVPDSPLDSGGYNQSGSTPSQCNTPSQYNNDYAVSAGYARRGIAFSNSYTTEKGREYGTDLIRCK